MNGYSRIRRVSTKRSKSIDFSDVSFIPKAKPPNPIKNTTSKPHENVNKENKKKNSDDAHERIQENENEDTAGGEIFGVILSRKCSVSSNPSNNFLSEKQNSSSSSVNSALKRTFKRSSSVSDGYSRIHHQSDSPPDDDGDDILMLNTMQRRSMKKKGKFFKACKRMFGILA